MSDEWEVIATAKAEYWTDPVLTAALLRRNGSEALRVTWPDGSAVEFPIYVFEALQKVARGCNSLPLALFGDTSELVQRLDRLMDHFDREAGLHWIDVDEQALHA